MEIFCDRTILKCIRCGFVPAVDQSSAKLIKHCERCGVTLGQVSIKKEKICPKEPLAHDRLIKTRGVEAELQKFCPACGSELVTNETVMP